MIIDTDAPITMRDVAQAEAQMGIELPHNLRAFYLEANGGRPVKRLFRRGGDGFLIHYFLPLKADNKKLGDVVSAFKTWEVVGKSDALTKAIPIAYDEAGNDLLYSIDPKSYGAIYCTWADAEPERRVRYLCDGLEEFLANLQEWS